MAGLSRLTGFLAFVLAAALVALFAHGDLGRESDPVILAVIGCVAVAGVSFWLSAHGKGDGPKRGGG